MIEVDGHLRLLGPADYKDAYEVMLFTGKQRDALEFYQKLGFDEYEKHGLVCRKPA